MDIPAGLLYTKEHEWVRLEENDTVATIGITDFAQGELGDIVFVELEAVDSEVDKNDAFGTVEAVKTVSELYMPLSGRITAINQEIESNPEYVNEDPYGKGWMIKVELSDTSEVDNLLSPEDYEQMVS